MRVCLKEVILHERYRIEEVIGYGGFAITYRATDLSCQTAVAIKEYFPKSGCERNPEDTGVHCTGDETFYQKNKERFFREAGILRELDGIDEVVHMIECFEENGTVYIVMEYVQGRTLSSCVKEQGAFEWEAFHDILKAIVSALIRVHEKGVIHRDLSPENMMLLADGSVKLLDFGAVKEVGTEVEVGDELTRPTEAIVKKGFAPVEQYQNWGNLGPWTDVYGLCATIYFCLTGKVMQDALDRALGVEAREEAEEAEDSGQKGQDAERSMPEHVRDAIRAGTQVRIADRPRDMEELYGLLFNDEKTKHTGKKRHVGRILCVLAGIGAALMLSAVWFRSRPDAEGNVVPERPEGSVVSESLDAEGSVVPEHSDAEGSVIPEQPGYVTLQQGEDIQAYLDKPYVQQVTVPEGVTAEPAMLSVQKRIVVEDGGTLAPGALVMEEGGYVNIEGKLALEASVVSIRRDGCCIEIGKDGVLSGDENTLYLLNGNEEFLHVQGGDIPNLGSAKIVREDEEATFADAVSVTNYEELKDWCRGDRAVSIDADIDIPEQILITVPLRISEGVTVSCKGGEWFVIASKVPFINRGVFRGGLLVTNGAAAVNYGTMETGAYKEWVGLWVEKNAAVVNAGILHAYLGSGVWKDGILFNMGEFMGYDLYLHGGQMINAGIFWVSGDRNGCVVSAGSTLWNKGTMEALPDAHVDNFSTIVNTGDIIVGEKAVFTSALLVNDGCFEARNGAELGSIPGVYLGEGEYRLAGSVGIENIARCKKAVRWEDGTGLPASEDSDSPGGERVAAVVATQEQLLAALADESAAAVFTEGAIIVSEDLTVEKPLLLFGDLTMQDGAEAGICGGALLVMEDAAIANAGLRLQGGRVVCCAAAFALKNSKVSIDEDSVFQTRNTDLVVEGTWMENDGTVQLEGWPEDSLDWRDSGVSGSGSFASWKQPVTPVEE